jgi:hypothetical protein
VEETGENHARTCICRNSLEKKKSTKIAKKRRHISNTYFNHILQDKEMLSCITKLLYEKGGSTVILLCGSDINFILMCAQIKVFYMRNYEYVNHIASFWL